MNYKRMLSISAISVTGLAIAILTTGCDAYSPNRTSFPNNSTGNDRNYPSSENDRNYPSSENGRNYPSSENDRNYPSSENDRNYPSSQRNLNQASEQMSGLNLTDAQKAQMQRIREESEERIFALLSPQQQQRLQSDNNGRYILSMKKLRSLNLSAEQKRELNDITREQRQQMQEILTPEQREMMNQRGRSPRRNSSY